MDNEESSRKTETSAEIAAPVEKVWKAISDAKEIENWFAPQARVDPGPDGSPLGGSIWLSWGEGAEGSFPIEAWEPNRHLSTSSERGGARLLVDYYLEASEGGTVLRVVQSGFGQDAAWDEEYEATRRAWPMFLRVLKHNLEQHPGEPARQISITLSVQQTPEEQWTRVLKGQLDGLGTGDHYAIKLFDGERLEGTIDRLEHRGFLTAIVDNWDRALMTMFCEKHKTGGLLTMGIVVYGALVPQAEAIEQRWRNSLTALLAA